MGELLGSQGLSSRHSTASPLLSESQNSGVSGNDSGNLRGQTPSCLVFNPRPWCLRQSDKWTMETGRGFRVSQQAVKRLPWVEECKNPLGAPKFSPVSAKHNLQASSVREAATSSRQSVGLPELAAAGGFPGSPSTMLHVVTGIHTGFRRNGDFQLLENAVTFVFRRKGVEILTQMKF